MGFCIKSYTSSLHFFYIFYYSESCMIVLRNFWCNWFHVDIGIEPAGSGPVTCYGRAGLSAAGNG